MGAINEMTASYKYGEMKTCSIYFGTVEELIADKMRDGCSLAEIAGALVFFGLADPSRAEQMVMDNILK